MARFNTTSRLVLDKQAIQAKDASLRQAVTVDLFLGPREGHTTTESLSQNCSDRIC